MVLDLIVGRVTIERSVVTTYESDRKLYRRIIDQSDKGVSMYIIHSGLCSHALIPTNCWKNMMPMPTIVRLQQFFLKRSPHPTISRLACVEVFSSRKSFG